MPKKPEAPVDIPARNPKFIISLDETATRIGWDNIQNKTIGKLKSLIHNDPRAQEMLGVVPGAVGADVEPELELSITEENVGSALDAINTLLMLGFGAIFPRVSKHPFKRTRDGKSVPFEIDKKILFDSFKLKPEQHEELDPRAKRILDKHTHKVPEWLKKNFDWYMLGFMFLKFAAENGQTAIKNQLQLDFVKAETARRASQVPNRPPDSDAIRITEQPPQQPEAPATEIPPEQV